MRTNSRSGRQDGRAVWVDSAAETLEPRRLFAAAPVTISTISQAAESGPTAGVFRVGRVGDNKTEALTVTLRLGGSATYGSDYTLTQPNATPVDRRFQVTIPAGEGGTLVKVTPIDDSIHEPAESVEVILVPPAGTTYDTNVGSGLTIADNDAETPAPAPIAHANGPYTVGEGRTETLHATAEASGDRTVVTYQWDLNYDGVTFDVNATGKDVKFNAAEIDGLKSGTMRTVAVRAIDSAGATSAISTSTVTIRNVAPTAILGGSTVRLGQSGTVAFRDIVDVPADKAAGFTYRYDFNNDGVFDLTSTSPTAVVPAAYLNTVGPHTVRASLRDKDDGVSTYTTVVNVTREETPQNTALLGGLAFNDNNANGTYDSGDTVSAGVTIFLDTNNNGRRDDGELSQATNSSGRFTFSNLPAGTYHVRRVFGADRTYSTPLINITLSAGQQIDSLRIGGKPVTTPVGTGVISGAAFTDNNHNGLYDSGDGVGRGVTVFLDANNNGVLDDGERRVVTNDNGRFEFGGLAAGTYHVRRVVDSGYVASHAMAEVTLAAGQTKSGLALGAWRA